MTTTMKHRNVSKKAKSLNAMKVKNPKFVRCTWDRATTAKYLGVSVGHVDALVNDFKVPYFLDSSGGVKFDSAEIVAWKGSREIENSEEW